MGGYGPVEKTYHMCRRRRWVRMRKLVKTAKMEEEDVGFLFYLFWKYYIVLVGLFIELIKYIFCVTGAAEGGNC